MIGITQGFESLAVALCQSLAESGPVRVDEFDDAWTPAGENYRDELLSGGLISVDPETHLMVLTAAGVALASGQATAEPATAPQP